MGLIIPTEQNKNLQVHWEIKHHQRICYIMVIKITLILKIIITLLVIIFITIILGMSNFNETFKFFFKKFN